MKTRHTILWLASAWAVMCNILMDIRLFSSGFVCEIITFQDVSVMLIVAILFQVRIQRFTQSNVLL